MLATSWISPDALTHFAWGPIAIPILGYLYFPWAISRLHLFGSHNVLKSLVIGLLAYELYRQALISVFPSAGAESATLIRTYCGTALETFGALVQCGAATFLASSFVSALLLLAPAALLAAVRVPSQVGPREA